MTYYHSCKGCSFSPVECDEREKIRSAIKGLHITSLKFKCANRLPFFLPGDRVSLKWRIFEEGDYDSYGEAAVDETTAYFYATVLSEFSGTRYIVRIDSGPCYSIEGNWDRVDAESVFTRASKLIVKAKTRDMSHTDQPRIAVCQICGALQGEKTRCHGQGKPGSWDAYWPTECILPVGDRV